jgi:hypothetical protein
MGAVRRVGAIRRPGVRRSGATTRPARAVAPVTGACVGGALAFFLDPQNGRRRRHVLADRTAALFRRGGRRAERAARHTAAETHGVAQRVAHPRAAQAPPPDDVTLTRKVETELFRDADVPKGTINVNVEHGRVILRGETKTPEQIDELGAAAARIPGVREVENLLHLPGTPPKAHQPPPPEEVRSYADKSGPASGLGNSPAKT